ncbi:unnamed protein product [Urochloa humidicola]
MSSPSKPKSKARGANPASPRPPLSFSQRPSSFRPPSSSGVLAGERGRWAGPQLHLLVASIVFFSIGALFSMVSVNKINPFPTPEPPASPRNTRLLLPPHARASAAQSHAPPPLSHLPPLRLNPLCGRTFDLQLASPPLALAHPKRSVQLHVPPSTSTLLLSFLPPRTPLSAAAVTLGSPSAGIPPVLAPLLRAMLGVAVQTGRPACRPESSTAAIGFLSEHGGHQCSMVRGLHANISYQYSGFWELHQDRKGYKIQVLPDLYFIWHQVWKWQSSSQRSG